MWRTDARGVVIVTGRPLNDGLVIGETDGVGRVTERLHSELRFEPEQL